MMFFIIYFNILANVIIINITDADNNTALATIYNLFFLVTEKTNPIILKMIENNTLKKINIKKPIKVRQNIVLSETLTFKLLFIVFLTFSFISIFFSHFIFYHF